MEFVKLPVFGSVDLDGKPFTINDNNVRKTQNLIPDKMGNLIRRGALMYEGALISTSVGKTPTSAAIHATIPAASSFVINRVPIWMAPPDLVGGRYVIGSINTDENRFDLLVNDGTKEGYNTLAVNALDTTPTNYPNMVTQGGRSYIVYGRNPWPSGGLILTPNDSAPSGFDWSELTFAGTGNLDFQPDFAVDYKGRVVYGLRDGRILWADRYTPTIIGSDALQNRSLSLRTIDTGNLVGLHPVMLDGSGSLASSGLLCVFQYGAKLILGEPLQSTESGIIFGDLQVNDLSKRAGGVSSAAICDTDWGTIWVGPDDVWIMPFGSVPIPIGRHISPLLKAQPDSMRWRIHATVGGGFLRVALYSDGQGPTVSSPLGEQWWLDLRDGPPTDWKSARWYGPHIFNCAADKNMGLRSVRSTITAGTQFMMKDPRSSRANNIYGCGVGLIPNLGATEVSALVLLSYDNPSPRDITGLFYPSPIAWQPNVGVVLGDEVAIVFTPFGLRPYIFRVTTAGVTGAVEPVWNTGAGVTLDNSAVWTSQGPALGPFDVQGSEITAEWDSKEYDFGSRMMIKLFNGLEINLYNSAEVQMNITQLIDGGRTFSSVLQNLDHSAGPVIGQDQFKDAIALAEEYRSFAARPSQSLRKNGKSCQYKIIEQRGIVLPDAFRTIGIRGDDDVIYHLTLAERYYASLNALIEAFLLLAQEPATTFSDKFGLAWSARYDDVGIITITNGAGEDWSPPPALSSSTADRYFWSLLGYTQDTITINTIQRGQDMPFDVLIGSGLGLGEITAAYHPFGRRPQ